VKKTSITFMALALSAVVGLAQDKPAAAPAAPAGDDPVIISAEGVQVHKSEFESALKSLPAEYQQFAQGPGKRQFADDYIRMKLLAAEGTKAGLDKDPEVQAQLVLLKENLIAQAELKKMDNALAVSDADLQKYYDAHKAEYEEVKARHILIAFKGSPAAQAGKKELTEDEAKAKAEDLRKQIVGGADFAALAKKESDDVGSGSQGGDLGSFTHGQMVPEFEKAAFEAKPGDVTPVVRTQYGYHIIQVIEHGATPFEQIKPTIAKSQREAKMRTALDDLKAKAVFSETYFPKPAPPPAPEAAAPKADAAKTDAAKPAPKAEASKPAPKKP
jgi:peptidyl-prolyl cis-trans isomerase C